MKYKLAEKAKQDRKVYAVLKELNENEFIKSMIEEEKNISRGYNAIKGMTITQMINIL